MGCFRVSLLTGGTSNELVSFLTLLWSEQ